MYDVIHIEQLSNILSQALATSVTIEEVQRIDGGSISQTYRIRTTEDNYFIKVNNDINAELMFKAEASGLDLLRANSSFNIPKVASVLSDNNTSYLVMSFIESSRRSRKYWHYLGQKLAVLHKTSNNKFGLHESNYIGSLPQQNDFEEDWPSFFANRRIIPMVVLAVNEGLVAKSFVTSVESVLKKIVELMPNEQPALVHGDLWSGNLIVDSQGQPCLIDPAVYYGHREMDIAFSHLFGGFDREFYEAYQEAYPMDPDFDGRIDLYNLYPLLVHLNLFGRSYLGQIENILARFT